MLSVVARRTSAELRARCDRHGVELTDLGAFTGDGRLVVAFRGETVLDLDTTFLHDGRPGRTMVAELPTPDRAPARRRPDRSTTRPPRCSRCSAHPNIALEGGDRPPLRPRDPRHHRGPPAHRRRSSTGRADGVVLAEPGDTHGFAIGIGVNPWHGLHDPYRMAYAAVDEAIRNVVVAGADPDGSRCSTTSRGAIRAGPRRSASSSLPSTAAATQPVAHGAPFVSGKDSLNNEYLGADGERHAVPPTLVITAVADVPDADGGGDERPEAAPATCSCCSGRPHPEFAGSHLDLVLGAPDARASCPPPIPAVRRAVPGRAPGDPGRASCGPPTTAARAASPWRWPRWRSAAASASRSPSSRAPTMRHRPVLRVERADRGRGRRQTNSKRSAAHVPGPLARARHRHRRAELRTPGLPSARRRRTPRMAWNPPMSRPVALVVAAPGTNRDHDVAFALDLAGAEPRTHPARRTRRATRSCSTRPGCSSSPAVSPTPTRSAPDGCSPSNSQRALGDRLAGVRRRRPTGARHLQRVPDARPRRAAARSGPARRARPQRRRPLRVPLGRARTGLRRRCIWTAGPRARDRLPDRPRRRPVRRRRRHHRRHWRPAARSRCDTAVNPNGSIERHRRDLRSDRRRARPDAAPREPRGRPPAPDRFRARSRLTASDSAVRGRRPPRQGALAMDVHRTSTCRSRTAATARCGSRTGSPATGGCSSPPIGSRPSTGSSPPSRTRARC